MTDLSTRRRWAKGCALVLSALCILCPISAVATPLDDYVAAEDPAFTYGKPAAKVTENASFTASVFKMTSQNWLDESKIDRTAWEHWVTIIVPKEVEQSKALLFVNGGNNRSTEPPTGEGALAQISTLTKSIIVDVGQIPNQPLKFPDEEDSRYKENGRSEDAMIAYAWDKFLVTGDPLWLPRLPMTKAIVRAMDLAQAEHPEIDGFFVVGGSKRGWTTWTVAAVDKRVVGIAPAVIDVLDVVSSLENHWAAYGFWAPAISDYEDMNILTRLQTPEFKALTEVVDPLVYKDRLTMPKYIVNSAGDQFFPPDSWKFYFDQLEGEKYLRYMANTDHGLSLEAFFNMASFFHAVSNGTPRPEFTWKKQADGALEVRCETKPSKVLLWKAHNPKGRDFRMENIGKVWQSFPVEESDAGVYRSAVEPEAEGWTAFFLELEFPNPSFPQPFKFTTGISITPDTYPGGKP